MNKVSTYPAYWNNFPELSEKAAAICSHHYCSDGTQLHILQLGQPSPERILILMPPMMPLLLRLRRLIRISAIMPLLAFEPRGWDDRGCHCRIVTNSVEQHAMDIEEVAAAHNIGAVHLITFCAGINTAFELLRRNVLYIKSACLITPPLPLPLKPISRWRTDAFEKMIYKLASADSNSEKRIYRRMLLMLKVASIPLDAITRRFVMLNFSTLESARCFAAAWAAFFKERDTVSPETLFRDLYERIPTFMLCVGDDDVAGCPKTFPSHPNLVVEVLEHGGHEIHPDMEVWSDIVCSSLQRFYERTFPNMAVGL